MGNVDVGLVNRAIIDNVSIEDREGNVLLKADRVSAKFDLRALLQGDIVINNVQLHNMHLNLAKRDSAAAPNYQFLIDAFSSDEPSSGSDLSLRINALLIRHGRDAYNLATARSSRSATTPSTPPYATSAPGNTPGSRWRTLPSSWSPIRVT